MTDFGHLNSYDISQESTAEFTLHMIEQDPEPVLIVAPANRSNRPYFNALLNRSKKYARALAAGNITAKLADDVRDVHKELFPKFVLRGWKHVKDAQGNDVEFTEAHCEQFLQALPDWIFGELRDFCEQPLNFVEGPLADPDEVSENLPSSSGGS